ncbi:hypothetical protein ACFXOL_06845 [Streptomyces californicus]|uniref:hypothetical protein n=1 Tax=Streptomyces californicus TaxID=67351 RepID=UPI00339DAC90
MTHRDDEPTFFALDYVTITRDPRTQLVVAIGGDARAAGILQTAGGFYSAPVAGRDYHRLPHHPPVEHQRHGATAAAHALLLAAYSVHLDPALNTLTASAAEQVTPPATTSTDSPSAPASPRPTRTSPPSWPRSPPRRRDCSRSWCSP